ncbi:hypothetical protein FHX37_0486 [Haloactinospora alba]|uniref:Uncharacterized protein n=1 Tax=Haloactinospora alba TaxID=405555 RepID=A0A543NFI8_9ACTN|nr:hypothetical protein [Haloactinospora alba]TQN30604.1 hypothetical protein FHX37_0486 [Haloactinospora alba]
MVEDKIRAELESLGAPQHEPGLCALAITLAARLDEAGSRDSSALSRELRETVAKIKTSVQNAETGKESRLDDLAARRAARASGTADSELPTSGEHGGG